MSIVKIDPSAGKAPGELLDKLLGQGATYPVRLAVTNVGKRPVVLLGASLQPIAPGATVTAIVRKREIAWQMVTDAAELAARIGGGQAVVQLEKAKDTAQAQQAAVPAAETDKKKGA